MKILKSISSSVVLILFCTISPYAQSTISSGGETIVLPGGATLQTTIGESVVLTIEDENNVFTQGQQQPDPLEPQPIPTMGEWGILILLLILMNVGIIVIKDIKKENVTTI